MNPRARTRPTAWLGLIAMWLIVCVPLISQLVAAHRAHEPVALLCSATSSGSDAHQGMQEGMLTACEYCDLLTTHAAMPPIPAVSLPLFALVAIAAIPALFLRFTPLGAFPSGRPRAPPAFC
jgi:Na+(H+)/acetate symporter ActP